MVRSLGDVSLIPTEFAVQDFETIFFANMGESDVSIVGVVNVVYLISRFLDNYERDKTVGKVLTKLY